MKKLLWLFLFLNILHAAPAMAGALSDGFTKEEKKFIRRANTARYALYMGKEPRRFILLMNLARTNGPLLVKYVQEKYGEDYADEPIIAAFTELNEEQKKPFLRPSFALHLGAASHSLVNGITSSEGHGAFLLRLLMFMNLNSFIPGVKSGENCDYGNRLAIESLIRLLESSGHRANILEKRYMRTGVSRNFHLEYGYNNVTMFTGPKLVDVIFYRKAIKKYLRK